MAKEVTIRTGRSSFKLISTTRDIVGKTMGQLIICDSNKPGRYSQWTFSEVEDADKALQKATASLIGGDGLPFGYEGMYNYDTEVDMRDIPLSRGL